MRRDTPMFRIESAGITDVGKRRRNNEDAMFLDDEKQLYIVADGMGGHQAGEVASEMVVDSLRAYMERFNENAAVEELSDPDDSLSKAANRLLSGIYLANKSVYQAAHSKEAYTGMGSTVSTVYFDGGTLIAANVGDSPIYLVHDGNIERLSVPHTVMAELDSRKAERLGGEFRHVLTRAIGVNETVQADISEIQCFKGDILVIGSDGLSDKIEQHEIKEVVRRDRPMKACRQLVELANERGGDDNITVVVLKVKNRQSKIGRFFRSFFKG